MNKQPLAYTKYREAAGGRGWHNKIDMKTQFLKLPDLGLTWGFPLSLKTHWCVYVCVCMCVCVCVCVYVCVCARARVHANDSPRIRLNS
jgi:hypothetical protein